MKVAVFDYIEGSVDIIDTKIEASGDFDWEEWLTNNGYNPASCAWMTDVRNISFKE